MEFFFLAARFARTFFFGAKITPNLSLGACARAYASAPALSSPVRESRRVTQRPSYPSGSLLQSEPWGYSYSSGFPMASSAAFMRARLRRLSFSLRYS